MRLPARRQAFLQPHLSPLLRILPQILRLNLTHTTPDMGENATRGEMGGMRKIQQATTGQAS